MGKLAESVSRISPRPHIPNRQPLGSPKSSIVPFDLFKEKYIIEKNDLSRRKSSKLFTPQSDGSCSETRGWNDLF